MPTRHARPLRAQAPRESGAALGVAGAGFTIDQTAAFVGCTAATVQHYHQNGPADEPEPDSAGCRRYRPAEILRLVQVYALMGAGVPATEIRALLDYLDHVERVLDMTGTSRR
ncbi:MerR family transcriptional regulator [Nocardia brevicatena]|uniref:MerR family transcriptional regulator n=1 Tax=Nocardia brevicatena TaxID=37327 RepID=UPI0005936750|nr:MerR family transcriptional regulator [Nocardia brevicatena]